MTPTTVAKPLPFSNMISIILSIHVSLTSSFVKRFGPMVFSSIEVFALIAIKALRKSPQED